MKRFLYLLLICCTVYSCWKGDPIVGTSVKFENQSEHEISISLEATFTPIEEDIKIKPGEKHSFENGSYGAAFEEATIIFDNTYTVTYKKPKFPISTEENEDNIDYDNLHLNICYRFSYDKTSLSPTYTVYTYTFTEEDYNYAVSVNKADKQ